MFNTADFVKSLPRRAVLLNLVRETLERFIVIAELDDDDFRESVTQDAYGFISMYFDEFNEIASNDIQHDDIDTHLFDSKIFDMCGLGPCKNRPYFSINAANFFASFSAACKKEEITFESHIKIFPDYHHAELLNIAYEAGSIFPCFGMRILDASATWHTASKAYIKAMESQQTQPDFEDMAKYGYIYGYNDVDELAVQDRLKMLQAAYKVTHPTRDHLRLFPDQAEYIKHLLRPLIMAKHWALAKIADATYPDVAVLVGSTVGY